MGKWGSDEIEELKLFYKQNNVPSDQLVKNKALLDTFTSAFNQRIEPVDNFGSEEIADQLFKLRKAGRLPRIRD